MKIRKLVFTAVLLLSVWLTQFDAAAQYIDQRELPRSTYIGLSLGMYDYGIGLVGEVPFGYNYSLFGNVGLGGWGYKAGAGIMYYPSNSPFGHGFGLGYTYAGGFEGFETTLTVEPNDQEMLVALDLYGVSTLNLMYSYSWALGRSMKFALVTGYAVKLGGDTYTVKTPGVELTSESKMVLRIMQPGGLTLGLRMMFGIN